MDKERVELLKKIKQVLTYLVEREILTQADAYALLKIVMG